MFSWASPQLVPARLAELLEHAGGWRVGPQEAPELMVFLPVHLLLSTGSEAVRSFADAYTGLDAQESPQRLVNGERLLGLRPAEIAHWLQGGSRFQRPLELAAVDPLLAAVTLAQLEEHPELVQRYERLDAHSERGGAQADHDYCQRLRPSAAALLAAWADLKEHLRRDASSRPEQQRALQEMAEELERQVLETRQAQELAGQRQQTTRRLLRERQRSQQLWHRLMALQGRLLAAATAGGIRP